MRHQAFGAGEVLARAARPVREVHVILEGDVVLRRDGEVVELLNPGGHFGRKGLELRGADEARALTRVRTLTLREDQANQLQDVLASTGRLAARTGSFPTSTRSGAATPADGQRAEERLPGGDGRVAARVPREAAHLVRRDDVQRRELESRGRT